MSKDKLVDGHVSARQCKLAVNALYSHAQKKLKEKEATELLPGPEQHVWLVVAVKQMHPEKKLKPFKIPIAHPIVDPRTSAVCLITKDPQREYKDLLESHGIKFISRVVGVTKLKGKFKPFEARRMLLKENGLFLADERVVPLLPGLLGKKWFEAKKQPIPVCLTRKDLKGELERAISSTYMHQNQGSCTSVKIGVLSQTPSQILTNLKTALPAIIKNIKGGWANIQSLNIKTSSSVSLPLWTCNLGEGEDGRWGGLVVGGEGNAEESSEEDDGDEITAAIVEDKKKEREKPEAVEQMGAVEKDKGRKRSSDDDQAVEQKKRKKKAAEAVAEETPKAVERMDTKDTTEGGEDQKKPSGDDQVMERKKRGKRKVAEGATEEIQAIAQVDAKADAAEGQKRAPDDNQAVERKKKRRRHAAKETSETTPKSSTPKSGETTAAPEVIDVKPRKPKKFKSSAAADASSTSHPTLPTEKIAAKSTPLPVEDPSATTPVVAGETAMKKRRRRKSKGEPAVAVPETPAAADATPPVPAQPSDDNAATPVPKIKSKTDAPVVDDASDKNVTTTPSLEKGELREKRRRRHGEKKKEKVVGSTPSKSVKNAILGKKVAQG